MASFPGGHAAIIPTCPTKSRELGATFSWSSFFLTFEKKTVDLKTDLFLSNLFGENKAKGRE